MMLNLDCFLTILYYDRLLMMLKEGRPLTGLLMMLNAERFFMMLDNDDRLMILDVEGLPMLLDSERLLLWMKKFEKFGNDSAQRPATNELNLTGC